VSSNELGSSLTSLATSDPTLTVPVSGDADVHESAYVNEDGSYIVAVLNPTHEAWKFGAGPGKCSGV